MKHYVFHDSSSVLPQEFIYCTLSNDIRHKGLWNTFEQDQDGIHLQLHPGPARKLSTDLYDIYYC
jgi:hypothetical protein